MKAYKKGSACVKCEERGASSLFVNDSVICPIDCKLYTNLYIRRTCKNCGYTWKEKPLDER